MSNPFVGWCMHKLVTCSFWVILASFVWLPVKYSYGQQLVQDEFELNKKALVIGITKYQHIKEVPSGEYDARTFGSTLEKLGYKIEYSINTTALEIFEDLKSFTKSLSPDDISIIYFSGHGFQYHNIAYFAAADTTKTIHEDLITRKAIPLDYVIERLEIGKPAFSMIIFDACRDTSMTVLTRDGVSKGPKDNMDLPRPPEPQILLAYSTYSGQIAISSSDYNKNSLYTKHLNHYISQDGLAIDHILREITFEVSRENPAQVPEARYLRVGNFFPKPNSDAHQVARIAWESAKNSAKNIAIEKFLFLFPTSRHAKAARQWLKSNPSNDNDTSANLIGVFQSTVPLRFNATRAVAWRKDLVIISNINEDTKFVTTRPIKIVDSFGQSKGDFIPSGTKIVFDKNQHEAQRKHSDPWLSYTGEVKLKTEAIGIPAFVVRGDDIFDQFTVVPVFYGKIRHTNLPDLKRDQVGVILDNGSTLDLSKITDIIPILKESKSNISNFIVSVKVSSYVEGSQSVLEKQQFLFLKEMQIRNKLIAAGFDEKNIAVEMPAIEPFNLNQAKEISLREMDIIKITKKRN